MSFVELLLIALGLSMDCFAVAISFGVTARLKWKDVLTAALFFGLFQGVMPVLGWLAGSSMKELISAVDHWIAFSILAFIGAKMILQSFSMDGKDKSVDIRNFRVALTLSVATSIDALITGIGFGFIDVPIVQACILITLVTFLVSIAGFKLGAKTRIIHPQFAEIFGGVVLILIGVKIVLDHVGVI
ncbi:MAG: manganese efflux pump MntP family protein [bacterium]